MSDKKKVLETIYEAIDEVNLQRAQDQQIKKEKETFLVGEGGVLDSLGLISFLSVVEEKLSQKYSSQFNILNEKILDEKEKSIRNVEVFADFLITQHIHAS